MLPSVIDGPAGCLGFTRSPSSGAVAQAPTNHLFFIGFKLKVEQGERRVERVGLHGTVVARADAAQGHTTAYEAQIENLKQVAALLRAELAEMRAQRDEWRARAERKSLAASIAVASRARSFWRRAEFAGNNGPALVALEKVVRVRAGQPLDER